MTLARLLLVLLLAAAPASAREIKVTTWNLNWLTLRPTGDPVLPNDVHGRAPEDFDRLRAYAAALDSDIVALQEVDGPDVVARIFPPDRYRILLTGDDVVQRVGFAVRRTLSVVQNPDLVGLDVQPEALHRLRSGADITVRAGSAVLRLLAIHLKTGCHTDPLLSSARRECATLRAQVPPLAGWIAQRSRAGEPFVVLGDFNREMDGPDDLFAAMSAAAPLFRATAGRSSTCWGGNTFIDHIMAGSIQPRAAGWSRPRCA